MEMFGRLTVAGRLIPAVCVLVVGCSREDSTGLQTSARASAAVSARRAAEAREREAQQRVARLLEAVEHGDSSVRREALFDLGELGPAAEAVVPALRVAVERDPSGTGALATETLGYIGPAAVPALAQLVTHEDRDVARTAHEALAEMGPQAVAAVPALIEALRDADARDFYPDDALDFYADGAHFLCGLSVRSREGTSADVLGRIGPRAVKPLIAALEDEDAKVRAGAAYALGRMGPAAGPAVTALANAMDRSLDPANYHVANLAAWALGQIGPAAKPAVPQIVANLREHWLWARTTAIALHRIDPEDDSAVAPLAARLHADPDHTRAAEGLKQLGAVAVPALVRAMHDDNPKVRRRAMSALQSMTLEGDPHAAAAVPALIERLARQRDWNRLPSEASLLARIGPMAKPAAPLLIRAMEQATPLVRMDVAGVLARVAPNNPLGLLTLIAGLKSKDLHVPRRAIEVLYSLGPDAAPAVAALIEVLDHGKDSENRLRAADALGAIGPVAHDAIPSLAAALVRDYPDDVVVLGTGPAHALSKISPEAAPILVAAFGNTNGVVSWHAHEALGNMGPDAAAAVPELILLLEGDQRGSAIDVLGKIGPGARAALPALERLKRDRYQSIRRAVREAIRQIQQNNNPLAGDRMP